MNDSHEFNMNWTLQIQIFISLNLKMGVFCTYYDVNFYPRQYSDVGTCRHISYAKHVYLNEFGDGTCRCLFSDLLWFRGSYHGTEYLWYLTMSKMDWEWFVWCVNFNVFFREIIIIHLLFPDLWLSFWPGVHLQLFFLEND